MKQSALILVLTLMALLLPAPSLSRGGAPQKSEPSSRAQQERTAPVDINGKRLRADERYVAERALADGRVVAYRRNRAEVAALVKALKEDGVTDAELLDPKTWMMIPCDRSLSSGCQGGCSVTQNCVFTKNEMSDKRTAKGKVKNVAVLLGRCRCAG